MDVSRSDATHSTIHNGYPSGYPAPSEDVAHVLARHKLDQCRRAAAVMKAWGADSPEAAIRQMKDKWLQPVTDRRRGADTERVYVEPEVREPSAPSIAKLKATLLAKDVPSYQRTGLPEMITAINNNAAPHLAG